MLVVDDEEDARRSLAELLAAAGWETVTVASAAEAFQHLLEHGEPSLMLLDLMMPGKTGAEFLEDEETRGPRGFPWWW